MIIKIINPVSTPKLIPMTDTKRNKPYLIETGCNTGKYFVRLETDADDDIFLFLNAGSDIPVLTEDYVRQAYSDTLCHESNVKSVMIEF